MTINLRRETHQMTLEKKVTKSDDDPGGLGHVWKVSPRFPVCRRVMKTALSLGESFSFSLVEVPMLSTSPNLDKSHKSSTSVEAIGGYTGAGGVMMKPVTFGLHREWHRLRKL
jgi:hypothetical protein